MATLEIHPQTKSIPESAIYRLVLKSKLPGAEKFQDYVHEKSPAVSGIMSPVCTTAIVSKVMIGHKKSFS